MGLCRVSAEGLGESDKLAAGEGPECVSYGSWGWGGAFDLLVGNQIFLSCIVKGRGVMGSGGTGVGEDSEMEDG